MSQLSRIVITRLMRSWFQQSGQIDVVNQAAEKCLDYSKSEQIHGARAIASGGDEPQRTFLYDRLESDDQSGGQSATPPADSP